MMGNDLIMNFTKEKKLKLNLISDELHKPVNWLGLLNDLDDRLIGGALKLTTV
jgi:hypothetical protein